MDQAKKINYGKSVPKHGLLLLYWFANIVEIDENNVIWMTFDPNTHDYGSHYYHNSEGVLEELDRNNAFRHIRAFSVGRNQLLQLRDRFGGNADESQLRDIINTWGPNLAGLGLLLCIVIQEKDSPNQPNRQEERPKHVDDDSKRKSNVHRDVPNQVYVPKRNADEDLEANNRTTNRQSVVTSASRNSKSKPRRFHAYSPTQIRYLKAADKRRMMGMPGIFTMCCGALFLALTSVSAVHKLDSINSLKKINYGKSVPKHGLLLLYWFANIVEIDENNVIWMTFDPNTHDYGSHYYHNSEGVLEELDGNNAFRV
ncbi:hypothetical protein EYF80_020483 [Liparis tanakae]|uniref:Uncharacterized protein n=1 Tax=Liparis tanakae TaxID=230148 RepID=A0A4Z2HWS4_9TELE|nr:hypothetical protein EYF80_020483 [Liparis tanakae]